jgi:3-isopropylmalate dehydrogenase
LGGTVGLFEPVHGSAPDLAGLNKANPIGAIGSVAMLLRYGLKLEIEAAAVEQAIGMALSAGSRTTDLASTTETSTVGCTEMASAITLNLSTH